MMRAEHTAHGECDERGMTMGWQTYTYWTDDDVIATSDDGTLRVVLRPDTDAELDGDVYPILVRVSGGSVESCAGERWYHPSADTFGEDDDFARAVDYFYRSSPRRWCSGDPSVCWSEGWFVSVLEQVGEFVVGMAAAVAAPAAVGVEEVVGPGGWDASFVPPAGFVAGGESAEVVGLAVAGAVDVAESGHAMASSSSWVAGFSSPLAVVVRARARMSRPR